MSRGLLGRAVVLAVLAGTACLLGATGLRGVEGMLGALAGAALVLAFLLVGQAPVAAAARGRRGLGAALLVLLYVARVLALVVAYTLVVTDGAGAVDPGALGVTVIVTALGWTAGTVWSAMRWRPMVVDPDAAAQPPPDMRR